MKSIQYFIIAIILSLGIGCFQSQDTVADRQWSSYRGYYSSGILDNTSFPDQWDVENGENIKWKVDVPGLALSCPVMWGDKLFITSAISKSDNELLRAGAYVSSNPVEDESIHDWIVYCYDKNSGEKLWERTSFTGVPQVKRHPKSTHANCTPATDGEHIVAFFGSEWEFGSSPLIHKGVVLIQSDVRGESFLGAFDVETGEEIWKKSREEHPGWCTPNIYSYGGKEYVVVNGYKHRGAYDFETGEEIWWMSGGGDIPVPTPQIGEGMIYFNSAHGRYSPVMAIKTGAKGDITLEKGETSNEFVQWSFPRGGSYMHSMLLYENHLYNVGWNGLVDWVKIRI